MLALFYQPDYPVQLQYSNTCHFQQPLYRKYQKHSLKVSLITKWLQMLNIIVYSRGYNLSNP